MTIHVNIGEAKTRLSQLIAAAEAGEDVVIDRAGQPSVRLEPVRQADAEARKKARFEAWVGSGPPLSDSSADSVLEPPFTDDEWETFAREKEERLNACP